MGAAPRYSDSDLEFMLQGIESDLVERKESLRGGAPTGIREAVCAFANDLPDHQRPGVVFVGADDAGKPTGLPITDALLRRLADIKTDGNIVPPPTLTVGKIVWLVMPEESTRVAAFRSGQIDYLGSLSGSKIASLDVLEDLLRTNPDT